MPLYKVLIPFARRVHGNRTNHDEGTMIRLSPREARSMVAGGLLELIKDDPVEIETATLPEPEQAVVKRPARRKRTSPKKGTGQPVAAKK